MVLVVVLCLGMLVACGGEDGAIDSDQQQAFEIAQEAFNALSSAIVPVEQGLNTIHGALRWAFNESRNVMGSETWSLVVFLNLTGLEESDVRNAVASFDNVPPGFFLTESSDGATMIRVSYFATAQVASRALGYASVLDTAEAYMNAANIAIRRLTSDFGDFSHLQELMDFYIAVSEALEWTKDPSRPLELEHSANTINDFKSNMASSQTRLSFVFD